MDLLQHGLSYSKWKDSRTYWNPDMNIMHDLSLVLQLTCGWVILFGFMHCYVMGPLAHYLIKDPPKHATSTEPSAQEPSKGTRLRKKLKIDNMTSRDQVAKLRHKFLHSFWKCFTYVAFVAYGMYAVSFETSWLWRPAEYHKVFLKGTIPPLLFWYYALETSYYVFSLGLLYYEPKMKDRPQMTLHHLVTIALLVTSYVGRMLKFGVPIMLLHDLADPFMELAKMFLYCGNELGANFSLAVFTGTFMYTRNWVFPRHIIWTIWSQSEANIYPFYRVTLSCLCTLAVLHVYWAGLILKIFYQNFVAGETTGDIREEE